MIYKNKVIVLLGLLFFLFGCSQQPHAQAVNEMREKQLFTHHKAWEGVWYRYGGTSKRGVDCSGYIYQTFKECFGLLLPRTTKGQMRMGRRISRARLKAGDLIFFKTGFKQRHVGIYIGKGYFTHASSSKGVTLSSLDNPYWKKHYLFSKRILP